MAVLITKQIAIDWKNENGQLVPLDPGLYAAAMEFCRREFGTAVELRSFLKVWVTAKIDEGVVIKITAIIGIQNRLDVPMFHIAAPEGETRQDAEEFIRDNDAILDRVRNYIADNGGRGTDVFVHVASEAWSRKAVKRNLKRLKARASNRVLVGIG